MRNILYTIAYNNKGELVFAIDAQKGEIYRCPGCNGEMIPRRSVELKKGAKRPHFAHKILSPNCKPESVLHFGFKRLLSRRIHSDIENNRPLPIAWSCSSCDRIHKGNLIKKARSVVEEYDLNSCRPDIALLDKSNQIVWVIEVVVTHAPDKHVLEYYRKHRIALARFDLNSDDDLVKATAEELLPDFVDQCVNPRCAKCDRFQQNIVLWIIKGGCWKCGCVMQIAVVEGGESRNRTYAGPEEFTAHELTIAKSKGCRITKKYSRTQRRSYLANTCMECGAFAGEFHMFTQYVAPAGHGELNCEKIDVGYYCESCDAEAMLSAEREEDEDFGTGEDSKSEETSRPSYNANAPEIPEWRKAKEGFCIRCRTPIVRNRYKPLCSECFYPEKLREDMNLDPPSERQFCLRCGENHSTTRWKPFCMSCFFVAGVKK